MSFSFAAHGATKQLALADVAAKMADVVKGQPVHARDQLTVQAVAATYLNLLPDDDSKDYSLSVNGSVSWNGETPERLSGANVGVGAYLVNRLVVQTDPAA